MQHGIEYGTIETSYTFINGSFILVSIHNKYLFLGKRKTRILD